MEWGGNGSNGYDDLKDNVEKFIYDINDENIVLTDGEDGEYYVPNSNISNFEYKLSTNKKIFPYTAHYSSTTETSVYPIFD